MSGSKPKPKAKTKSNSKSKRKSPRLYDPDELAKFLQSPLVLGRSKPPDQMQRRPKSEIVRELQRLRALPPSYEEDDDNNANVANDKDAVEDSQPVQTLEQLDALRLTRHRIEQLLACASFEQAVSGCFVRVNISEVNTPPEYRIGEIMAVVELAVGYYVGGTPTNIALELRYEDLRMQHELNDISNMAFTGEEFELWHDNCICQALEWPTTELIARKKIELYNALNCEGKLTSLLKQNGILPLSMPMRPLPRGGLLERLGGVYPWKLQGPSPPALPAPPAPPASPPESSLELIAADQNSAGSGIDEGPKIDVTSTEPSLEPNLPASCSD